VLTTDKLTLCSSSHISPHPGNILVLDDGRIGLIDFGLVKQINGRNRETLCKVMIALDDRVDGQPDDMDLVGKLALELGVELKDTAPPEAAAAVGIWLFDGTVKQLPGGYDMGELSPNSPVKELKSFPQDLVMVGRSSILIKGLSNRLHIPWSLAKEWAPTARAVLDMDARQKRNIQDIEGTGRVRFRSVWRAFKQWGVGRSEKAIRRLPSPVRTRVAALIVRSSERAMQKQLTR
jgi:predicted unusual protein kinase regulating ubiquinone biosynthesis (AarF/ABC1/UbiB family)